jgi:hypothetical protein
MNRKAAITFIEILLLAMAGSAFVITYVTFAESSKQQIMIQVVDTERNEECSTILMSVYRNDYVRSAGSFVEEGSYTDLAEFYGNFPINYVNPSRLVIMSRYSDKVIQEGSLAGDCSIRIFNPYEIFRGGRPYTYVSVGG